MQRKWWNDCVFYEIYMPSFMDGNCDGIGDFNGITSKLDELKELGVGGIWLTPFYKSPKIDNGYDISDYCSVDNDYGSLADFDTFVKEAHARNISVVIDIVLNHTSTEHPWFLAAKNDVENPKRDFYIWQKEQPNQWKSFFGGSAWEFNTQTNDYYYHAFAKEQADLNWSNPAVHDAMIEVLQFWVARGVDGFRVDVINFLKVKNQYHLENPIDEKGEQLHCFDKDQDGIIEVVKSLMTAARKLNPDLFLIGEVGSEDLTILKPYTDDGLLDVVFNFNLGSIETFTIQKVFSEIENMENVYSEDKMPTIFFNSHDMPRSASRFHKKEEIQGLNAAIAGLLLTLRGVPFLYYGEEIGMQDIVCTHIDQMHDVQGKTYYSLARNSGQSEQEALAYANQFSRDKSRGIMQWENKAFFGFSEKSPWLMPSATSGDRTYEVAVRELEGLYHIYKNLIQLRKKYPSLQVGKYINLTLEKEILIFEREYEDEVVRCVFNFSSEVYKIAIENYEVLYRNGKDDIAELLRPYEFIILNFLRKNEVDIDVSQSI